MSSSDRNAEQYPAQESDSRADESPREAPTDEVEAVLPDGRSDERVVPGPDVAPCARRQRARRKPFVLRAVDTAENAIEAGAAHPLRQLARLLQNLGPYLLIEVLLPGGTLLAFLLYASRSGRPFREDAPVLATLLALATAAARAISQWAPLAMLRGLPNRTAERDGLEPLGLLPG